MNLDTLMEMHTTGYLLAWCVLAGLLAALAYAGISAWRSSSTDSPAGPLAHLEWTVPVLALIGLGIAAYLAYVEGSHTQAVCGPVGDCNAVQNSPYSRLLGLPLGAVGLAGYAVILAGWLWSQSPTRPLAEHMPWIVFGVALFSALFSLYLTVLELFVIQAVCIWCLGSALVVSLILILSTGPIARAGSAA